MEENTRPASIKRFLSKPPKAAAKLVLTARVAGTESAVGLQEWEVTECRPELCDTEITPTLDEHSQEMNAALVATLTWWTASGVELATPQKVILRSNINVREGQTSLGSTADQLTGDMTSQASQAQKHLEVMTKMYLGNMNELFKLQRQAQEHTMELCDRLAQRVVDSERVAERAKQEKQEMEEVLTRVEESDGSDGQVTVAQSQIVQQLLPFLPQLLQLLSGGQALPPPPQTPPQ